MLEMLLFQVLVSVCVISIVSCDSDENRKLISSLENPVGINTDTLVEVVLSMADTIKALEVKVERLARIEETVGVLEKELLQKSTKIDEMDRVIQNLLAERGGSKDKVVLSQQTMVPKIKREGVVKHRGIRQEETVAFSVVLSKDLVHIGIKQTIKFDKILLNDGNAYEPQTGSFTAPMAGTYLFIYNLGHHGTGETWLELVKNGATQNGAAVEGHFAGQNLQGGNAAILRLNQGDTVWVEAFQVPDVTAQAQFTTFSGAFLY